MKNILILEDDNNRITTFNQRLSKSYNLTIVKHAYEAVDLLKNNTYDLIFLDHDLNGKQIEYDEEDCGTVVAKYMNENNIKTDTFIHSFI